MNQYTKLYRNANENRYIIAFTVIHARLKLMQISIGTKLKMTESESAGGIVLCGTEA